MKTTVEWLVDVLSNYDSKMIELFNKEIEQAKEMEAKQRQEDKLTWIKETNKLLDELIEKNMCSNSGDILIKQFKKRINL